MIASPFDFLALAQASFRTEGNSQEESKNGDQLYTCPMHPEVKSNKPGKCPKCGMDLVRKQSQASAKSPEAIYTCPMHPEVKSAKPGKCPKCGMDLVLKQESQADQKMSGHNEYDDMAEMTRDMRRPWLWTNSMLIMLGLWLISSPFTFGYQSPQMSLSDIISGALLFTSRCMGQVYN